MYDPTRGRILIDGHDLREVTLASLSAAIGMVTQETHLFHDTIRTNLLYARLDADMVVRFFKGRPVAERRIPQKKVQNAFQAYWEHQGMHAPHFILPPALNLAGQYSMLETDPGSLAYSFEYGSAAFFVMDTRSMRVRGPRGRTILGSGQWQALEAWLLSVKDHYPVKFLVFSSSMFFRMGVDIPMDRWSGFPEERDRLLGFIANNNIRGIYVLSGDLHAANSLEIDLTGRDGRPIKIWEFCSTPFEQAPNKMAKWSRLPIRSKWVDHQRCHFVVTQNNFGIVQVDFSNPNQPHVGFKVMGEKGAVLAEVGG